MIPNRVMFIDSMYSMDRLSHGEIRSLLLRSLAKLYKLPEKLDVETMAINLGGNPGHVAHDQVQHQGCRPACLGGEEEPHVHKDVHAHGLSRTIITDVTANNTGVMGFCLTQTTALSLGRVVDLGINTSITNDMKFKGGYVLELKPGCYKGVVMIDGNSLYGSLMLHLQIFVDRCSSANSIEELSRKLDMSVPIKWSTILVGGIA